MNESSYTAADSVPYKLFHNAPIMDAFRNSLVPLSHLQFVPTNRCNLHCSFCSCENRNRTDEMSLTDCTAVAEKSAALRCQSVTVTGGGEPLMHADINEIIAAFISRGMQVGLVTNGELLDRLTAGEMLTWCRISCADERMMPREAIERAVARFPSVDWAFSYVLSASPNIGNLREHVRFAEEHGFTHVRVVADLLDVDSVPMDDVKRCVDSPLIIWQQRTHAEFGASVCHVSQLKPQIGADGMVYPCCGVQYATETPKLDLTFALGHFSEMPFEPFDGSVCVRCYYGGYNRAIDAMVNGVAHGKFI